MSTSEQTNRVRSNGADFTSGPTLTPLRNSRDQNGPIDLNYQQRLEKQQAWHAEHDQELHLMKLFSQKPEATDFFLSYSEAFQKRNLSDEHRQVFKKLDQQRVLIISQLSPHLPDQKPKPPQNQQYHYQPQEEQFHQRQQLHQQEHQQHQQQQQGQHRNHHRDHQGQEDKDQDQERDQYQAQDQQFQLELDENQTQAQVLTSTQQPKRHPPLPLLKAYITRIYNSLAFWTADLTTHSTASKMSSNHLEKYEKSRTFLAHKWPKHLTTTIDWCSQLTGIHPTSPIMSPLIDKAGWVVDENYVITVLRTAICATGAQLKGRPLLYSWKNHLNFFGRFYPEDSTLCYYPNDATGYKLMFTVKDYIISLPDHVLIKPEDLTLTPTKVKDPGALSCVVVSLVNSLPFWTHDLSGLLYNGRLLESDPEMLKRLTQSRSALHNRVRGLLVRWTTVLTGINPSLIIKLPCVDRKGLIINSNYIAELMRALIEAKVVSSKADPEWVALQLAFKLIYPPDVAIDDSLGPSSGIPAGKMLRFTGFPKATGGILTNFVPFRALADNDDDNHDNDNGTENGVGAGVGFDGERTREQPSRLIDHRQNTLLPTPLEEGMDDCVFPW